MSMLCSNASALATEQVKRSERAASENPNTNNTAYIQHRRHNSLSGRVCTKTFTKSCSITDIPQQLENVRCDPNVLPNRITDAGTNGLSWNSRNLHSRNNDEVDSDETRRRRLTVNCERNEQQQTATKDGFLESKTTTILNTTASAMLSHDETEHLQHRFARTASATVFNTRQASNHSMMDNNSLSDVGFSSDLSSPVSSTCPSTVSSPLSTPTRLTPQHKLYQHQHRTNNHQQQQQQSTCCEKSIAPVKNSCSSATTLAHHNSQHNYHQHHLPEHHPDHDHHQNKASSFGSVIVSGSKNLKKFDPRLGPSPYRQLLPIALCILSFATVFSILIVYMDTTEIRHQQFRLNMSRDYELFGVAQDDPQLIAFLREIHMRKYPTHFFKTSSSTEEDSAAVGAGGGGTGIVGNSINGIAAHLNLSAFPNELTPKMAYYVANTMQGKTNGAVIQSLTGSLGHLMTAPWLTETLNWAGVIVEPEPRRYFTLRKQNALRPRLQIVHACVSPNPYPKEVTIHNEESEVRINSLLDEETSWFNSRVKCFPLYTIMLASNRIEYDLLSLGVHGHELEILQTLPFDKVKIEIISIHLLENQDDVSNYIQTITKFLQEKSYKMQKKFGRNYFYQRLTSTTTKTMPTRTRKKDILLLKTP